jgi:hypothetical protein
MKHNAKSSSQRYSEAQAARRKEFKDKRQGNGRDDAPEISLEDFYAYMPMHSYIYTPSREMWPGASINARIPPVCVSIDEEGKFIEIKASTWLDQNNPVEQMTWAPGLPMVIKDRLVSDGGGSNVRV